MQPGESRTASVDSHCLWNDTGVVLEAGQLYRFEASGTWTDSFIPYDADGAALRTIPFIVRAFLWLVAPLRRAPRQNWFVLMGAIDRDRKTLFRIGSGRELEAPATGRLTCYANDEFSAYLN